MFDNMNRVFSRRGTDKDEIATSSAILDDMTTYNDGTSDNNIERDLDTVSFDEPAINDMVEGDSLDRMVPATPAMDELLSADDVLRSANDGDGDDDFESI